METSGNILKRLEIEKNNTKEKEEEEGMLNPNCTVTFLYTFLKKNFKHRKYFNFHRSAIF
jgi:hypothetical protein